MSDYADTSSIQSKVAELAAVDPSAVTINVTAASVLITATIAVPAATTSTQVQATLSAALPDATAATAAFSALNITVESVPTIVVAAPPPSPPVPASPSEDSLVFASQPPPSLPPGGSAIGVPDGVAFQVAGQDISYEILAGSAGGAALLLCVLLGLCVCCCRSRRRRRRLRREKSAAAPPVVLEAPEPELDPKPVGPTTRPTFAAPPPGYFASRGAMGVPSFSGAPAMRDQGEAEVSIEGSLISVRCSDRHSIVRMRRTFSSQIKGF